jgi:hypothetical protein
LNGGPGTDLAFSTTGTDTYISIDGPFDEVTGTGCSITIP